MAFSGKDLWLRGSDSRTEKEKKSGKKAYFFVADFSNEDLTIKWDCRCGKTAKGLNTIGGIVEWNRFESLDEAKAEEKRIRKNGKWKTEKRPSIFDWLKK